MQNTIKSYIISAIVFLVWLIWILIGWMNFINKPLLAVNQKPVSFLYNKGASVQRLVFNLYQTKVLKHPGFFWVFAHLNGSWHALQAGEYFITPGMRPADLLQEMVKGEKDLHGFTIVEGWTFPQILAALANNQYVIHTLFGLNNDAIMRTIQHEGTAPEGRFAAETYLFHLGIKDVDILKIAYNLLDIKLNKAWQDRAPHLPYHCPYEALIAASIVEKETAVESERFKVAGIIARRLAKHMYLDMDPTVIYGLRKDFASNYKLTAGDMKKNTAYNTYLHYGLPPTPIATPSLSSLNAVLHPASGDELYFVARGNGRHEFSATLHEQNQAIHKYLKMGN